MTDEFVLRVLRVFAFDHCGDIFWRTDDEYAPVTFMVKCSDLFDWGSADCETVTPENIEELERAFADAKAADPEGGAFYASLLFCARVCKMRPQGAYYKSFPGSLWPLFDACGPERKVGPEDFGNTPRPEEPSR